MPDPSLVATARTVVEEFFRELGARLTTDGELVALALEPSTRTVQHVLDVARPLAYGLLDDPRVLGGGFVAAPGVLSDGAHLLAWWQGENKEPISASAALQRAADYTRQEWFRTPQRTSRLHVTGPYVDYVCTDDFVLTTTVPVTRDGEMLGVMGADILAETLESEMLIAFRDAGATLVNHHDRVVLSGQARTFAGDIVDRSNFTVVLPCDALPLTVIA